MHIFANLDETTGAMRNSSKNILCKSFVSEPAVLEEFYTWLETELKSFPLEPKEAERVVMAAAEAFLNAIVHGNRVDPGKKVEVELCLSGARLLVRIGDEGPGSAPRAPKKSRLLDTSGRGWELMHQLADGVKIHRENGFFWVELSFKMPKSYTGKRKAKGEKRGVGKVRISRR